MSAEVAVRQAQKHGVRLSVDGESLIVDSFCFFLAG